MSDEDYVLDAVKHSLEVFCKALDKGGVSAGRLAEMLGYRIGQLHSAGLQRVANAITEAAKAEASDEEHDW